MQKNNLILKPTSLTKPVLFGASIGLLLIVVYLAGVKNPNPAWGKFWMVRPLFMMPFAGAMGGLFFALMQPMRSQGGWKKILANVLSLLIFMIGLFMGFVLGLDGTLWN